MPKQVKILIDDTINFNLACAKPYNVKFRDIEERSKSKKSFVTVKYLDFSQAKEVKSLTLVVELKDGSAITLPDETEDFIRLPKEEKKSLPCMSIFRKTFDRLRGK